MPTVDELARDVLAALDTDAKAIAVAKWIDNRYKELVARVRFRHLRQIGELSLPSVYNTGTISATRGSASITGSSTQFVTDIGSGDQEYYQLRVNQTWYNISSVEGEEALTLESAFAEDSVSTASYSIIKRWHPLVSNARWIGDFYHTRLRSQLTLISLDALDILAPGRPLISNVPHWVAQVGVDSNTYPTVEIYPPPEQTELINYIYWKLPPTLAYTSTIPPVIDSYVLKEGVMIDLYRFEKAAALRKGNIEQATVWRNEEKSQFTIWEKCIRDAIRTSRGADDLTIILEMYPGASSGHFFDQRTAREYIYDNWSR